LITSNITSKSDELFEKTTIKKKEIKKEKKKRRKKLNKEDE